ncbi:hypothetical protein AJ78_03877 [Emergomyces pasteurianus Ep9510]|uniref:25S rRNA (Uridine(2843)-N(3))-methyltransferase n=1 Tax=Emergomyces pasteurianus Ep9510 TaxID=1447872 RepID=A0A1J9PJ18_9EURO|nr:hypothetical protein AJ78_03877 [Emergomyces pasteurianus Ep9510]
MGIANRRGKDGQNPKSKNSVKPKNASGTAQKFDSVKRKGKFLNKGVEAKETFFASNSGKSKTLLESKLLPIPLQQLLLNVFQSGLLADGGSKSEPLSRPLSELVQILKTHLYHRDFLSAFADANEELLKAYALRWSAGRALGYAGIFASLFEMIVHHHSTATGKETVGVHAVCIGGGAGAEIVGLAAAWRWLNDGNSSYALAVGNSKSLDEIACGIASIQNGLKELTVRKETQPASNPDIIKFDDDPVGGSDVKPSGPGLLSDLSITCIDIADWSPLVNSLSEAISTEVIPSSKACPAPLAPCKSTESQGHGGVRVFFKRADVLNLSDQELRSILVPSRNGMNIDTDSDQLATERSESVLVTLMFTLNELFSTSIPKTTAFLLRLTNMLGAGTTLLIVDSPGSYSTVSLNTTSMQSTKLPLTRNISSYSKRDSAACPDVHASTANSDDTKPHRNYPMRFLLDHALLSVADGKWESVMSDDSRWFRRDTSLLKYQVGDGIGLEDMRFQIHVYRRLKG